MNRRDIIGDNCVLLKTSAFNMWHDAFVLGSTQLWVQRNLHASNSNKWIWLEKWETTKQKNAIHHICQKIQSNSSTVKIEEKTNTREDTLSKVWHHIIKQTLLHGGRHSYDVICQNHWRSYFHHISQCVLISLKQQPAWARA